MFYSLLALFFAPFALNGKAADNNFDTRNLLGERRQTVVFEYKTPFNSAKVVVDTNGKFKELNGHSNPEQAVMEFIKSQDQKAPTFIIGDGVYSVISDGGEVHAQTLDDSDSRFKQIVKLFPSYFSASR